MSEAESKRDAAAEAKQPAVERLESASSGASSTPSSAETPRRRSARLSGLQPDSDCALPLTPRRTRRMSTDSASSFASSQNDSPPSAAAAKSEGTSDKNLSTIHEEPRAAASPTKKAGEPANSPQSPDRSHVSTSREAEGVVAASSPVKAKSVPMVTSPSATKKDVAEPMEVVSAEQGKSTPVIVPKKMLMLKFSDEQRRRLTQRGNEENSAQNLAAKGGLPRSDHELAMRLGRKKSGRVWKSDRDRFKSLVKPKGLKQVKDSQKRVAKKRELLRVKEFEKSLREEKKQKFEELRRRQEENKKRRKENELKSEIVQKITNPNKIKRMKKKQLRMLAKRDTTVVEK